MHATTLFTNALIERKGARHRPHHDRGLPRHARDRPRAQVRAVRSQHREARAARAAQPAPRSRRALARRRRRAQRRSTRSRSRAARRALVAGRASTSIAVVFLHAYANPSHEAQAARAHRRSAIPEIAVTTSARGRAGDPRVRARLDDGRQRLHQAARPPLPRADGARARRAAAFRRRCSSCCRAAASPTWPRPSGRRCRCSSPARRPARSPRAFFGRADSGGKLLAFDMGGTTAKLSLVDERRAADRLQLRGGAPEALHRGQRPAHPHLDHRADRDRRRRRQHRARGRDRAAQGRAAQRGLAARARPATASAGPEPTVTDADLLLGYLNPDYFAGGDDRDRPRRGARRARRGSPGALGCPPIEVAWGIHDIVNENMASAARVHIAERGRDPRDYALLCTGRRRARPRLRRRAEARPAPGDLPAVGRRRLGARPSGGAGARRPRRDRRHPSRPGQPARARGGVPRASRTRRARSWPTPASSSNRATSQRLADGRFLGQGFDLVVPLPDGPYDDARPGRRAPTAHRGLRGRVPGEVLAHAARGADRVHQHPRRRARAGRGQRGGAPGARAAEPIAALKGRRPACFPEAGGFVETTVYDREHLAAGDELRRAGGRSRRKARRSSSGPGASCARRSDRQHRCVTLA